MVRSFFWDCFHRACPNLSWFVLQSWRSLFFFLLSAFSRQTGLSWSPDKPPPDLLFASFILRNERIQHHRAVNLAVCIPPFFTPASFSFSSVFFFFWLQHTPRREKPGIPLSDWGGTRGDSHRSELLPAATAVPLICGQSCSLAALVSAHT